MRYTKQNAKMKVKWSMVHTIKERNSEKREWEREKAYREGTIVPMYRENDKQGKRKKVIKFWFGEGG